ncbi:hypothetical protein [Marivita sp.]|jgi:hypothetical protein|uniref:DUF7220 family protein n=1 Tax=Marivita sp. TaxID=2003365 RepID=UPI00261CF21C|nr:hypothetical protein [Marivita sp.]
MKQSRLMSLIEAITNVIVGYGLAVITQIIVFPWFGIEATLGEHLAIGMAFVCVSLARSYLLRRLFERIRVANRSGGRGEHGEPARHRR